MWSAIDDLMFERENLRETIRYCQAHNHIIRDLAQDEIEKRFWHLIRSTLGTLNTASAVPFENRMEPVYNAWFVIDPTPKGLVVPMEGTDLPRPHMVNFFVRMGRLPAIERVK